MHLCIVGVAVGVSKVITGDRATLEPEVVPYLTVPLVGVLVALAALELLSGDGRVARVVAVLGTAAALVGMVGVVGRYADPAGLEATSLALAAIMGGSVALTRHVRPHG